MRRCLLVVLVIVSVGVGVVPATPSAVVLPRVPRQVYFAPCPAELRRVSPLLASLPDYVYTSLCETVPIIRADNAAEARNIVRISIPRQGTRFPVVELVEGSLVVESIAISGTESADDMVKTADEVCSRFSPHLGFVEPTLTTASRDNDVSAASLVSNVSQADMRADNNELDMNFSGLVRFPPFEAERKTNILSVFPISLEYARYLSRSFALVASLWIYAGSDFTFGTLDGSDELAYVDALFALPGVGVQYRTLGRFSARVGAMFRGGYGYVTNPSSLPIRGTDQSSIFLSPGESRSIFYSLLSLYAGVGYDLNEHLLLFTRASFEIYPTALTMSDNFAPYPIGFSEFFMNLLSLGVLYRF
ncbi:hypothetical protein [Salinispira pacifica]